MRAASPRELIEGDVLTRRKRRATPSPDAAPDATPSKNRALYNPADFDRFAPEPPATPGNEEVYRHQSRKDYARLIHSAAFRRLQGKTQLFPNHESDFFRNRLTHSLEVAQIAKSIAVKLNSTEEFFRSDPIATDVVETAALAHDLGHPPFGHNGEKALDEAMANFGGFEGNAQTLRILSKLEKKRTRIDRYKTVDAAGRDQRAGLNLTARVLAAVLKYDNEIPRRLKDRKNSDVVKGYYHTERELVARIKKSVLGKEPPAGEFKTVECSIMDVADDIAYSTYDIEDALKGGFTSPIDMISASPEHLRAVADTVKKRLDNFYPDLSAKLRAFSALDARDVFVSNFATLFAVSEADAKTITRAAPKTMNLLASDDYKAFLVASANDLSNQVASDGYRRTQLTSDLVGKFIRGVEFIPDHQRPALSRVRLKVDLFKEVETFKVFAYESLINSARLKLAEYSGKSIVKTIFEKLNDANNKGYMLLPEDFRGLYQRLAEPDEQARVVCDFVAGMTDRYAMEFYSRLTAPDKATLWKPL
jgi:dGTPase